MKVSSLIKKLQKVKEVYGDIEVTCTGSLLPDGSGGTPPDVFETTVENFEFFDGGRLGRRVRLFM